MMKETIENKVKFLETNPKETILYELFAKSFFDSQDLLSITFRLMEHQNMIVSSHEIGDEINARKHFNMLYLYFFILISNDLIQNLEENQNKLISEIYSNVLSCFIGGEFDGFYRELHQVIQKFRNCFQHEPKERPFVQIIWNQEKQEQNFQYSSEISVNLISNHMNKKYKSC